MRNYTAPSAFSSRDVNTRHWKDLGLQRAGYSWDYFNEHLFSLPNAVVTNKRLAENGPAYKALIFDQFLGLSSDTARGGLSIAAAQKILAYAKDGLPVIFVGSPTGTAGVPVSDDATLNALVAQILAQPSASQVASEADVPAKLAALGLDTAVRNRGVIQNYGLVGPVVLTPYRQAAVYSSASAGGSVGGTVPATLSLALGSAPSFGAFTRVWTARMTRAAPPR